MSLTLPDELAWILHRAGGQWPDADEDALGEYARSWRAFAAELRSLEAELAAVARGVQTDNEGGSVDAFGAYSADHARHVTDGAEAAEIIADGFDGMAQAVVATKTAIIGALAEAASQINAARAAAGTAYIGVLIKVLVRVLRWVGPIIWRFLVRLANLVRQGIVWLFRKAADLFRKIINWFRGLGKTSRPNKPVYTRDGKLPPARKLIQRGTEWQGTGRKGGKLPKQSQPNSVLYRRDPHTGRITNYSVYDENGYVIKRVDLEGRPHNGIDPPHVVEYEVHTNPNGKKFPEPVPDKSGAPNPRPAHQREVP